MCWQSTSERARAARVAIKVVVAHGLQGGLTFDHLKAVGGHEQRLGRRVVAVVGAADALHQAFDVLRRADLNDQIDIAPVDAKIKAEPVQTTARRAPAVMAASTRSRCSRESEPWWMPMGRSSVFSSQRL